MSTGSLGGHPLNQFCFVEFQYSWVELNPVLIDFTYPVHNKMVPHMPMLVNNNNLDRQDTHLGVGSFCLCDGAIKSGAGSEPLRQALVDSTQLL